MTVFDFDNILETEFDLVSYYSEHIIILNIDF